MHILSGRRTQIDWYVISMQLFTSLLSVQCSAGHGKFHFFLLLACGLSLMSVVVENVNIGFVLPYARCDLHITTTEQGLLNSVGYLGIVISSHCWGFLADTWGRRKVLRCSILGSLLCAIVSAFSLSVNMLILTRLLVGIL